MITLNALTLPEDLTWSDEFAWSAVRQVSERSLTGKLMIDDAPRIGGRPITLVDGWAERSLVEQLYALKDQAGQTHTLTIAGTPYNVMFRQADGAMTATPVKPMFPADVDAGDFYIITLRFMVV